MMKIDPEVWPILSRLLDQWLDLAEESRARWLENLGPEYASALPVLRQLIVNQASIEAEGFLNTLPRMDKSANYSATAVAPLSAVFVAGALIGPYRLASELGQGGMGVVWLAERADGEVKRPVALKLPIVSVHNRTLADRFKRSGISWRNLATRASPDFMMPASRIGVSLISP
jgi:serine/threonine-protein kinase